MFQIFTRCFRKYDQIFFVYLNDILIFSHSKTKHVQHMRAILLHLPPDHVYVKVVKCKFHATTVLFIGLILPMGKIQKVPGLRNVYRALSRVRALLPVLYTNSPPPKCIFLKKKLIPTTVSSSHVACPTLNKTTMLGES